MNKKKLLILEDSSQRSFGGGQKISLLLINNFLNQGFEVNVYDICKNSDFYKKLPKGAVFNSYIKKFRKLKKINPINKKIANLLWFLRIISFIISYKDFKNSYIVSCTKKTHILVLLIKLIYGNKFKNGQLIIYNHMSNQGKFFEEVYHLINYSLEKVCQIFHSSKNQILHIFVSKFAQDSFNKFSFINKKYRKIIYNPSIEECKLKKLRKAYNLVLTKKKKKIVIISSLNKYKGVIECLKAFISLSKKKLVSFELHIYGYGEMESEIQKICKLDNNLYYCGKIDSPLMALKDAYCVILPSIIPEACPLVAIESICSGRPCFSLDLGGQKEILKHSNKVINNKTIYDLLKSIQLLDKQSLLNISKNACDYYDASFSLKKYESAINFNIN